MHPPASCINTRDSFPDPLSSYRRLAPFASIQGIAFLLTTGNAIMICHCLLWKEHALAKRYPRVIDAHMHWYPQEFVDLMIRKGPANGAVMGEDDKGNPVVV